MDSLQSQPQKQGQLQNTKTILLVVAVLLVLGLGYILLSGKYQSQIKRTPTSVGADNSAIVTVKNTPMVNGALPVPDGFPPEIPLESSVIVDSATTHYPEINALQLSVSYESQRTIAEKYAEYLSYMQQAGYEITEGDANAPVRAIFGTEEKTNLTVVVSDSANSTLVQISYLLK
ncbi:MAG: hypothetical protein HYT68_00555 [Candidatus Zambryskibacteria bacterium]|nr:hypothetical protein [Candidatus Zambryskibacteria bacterium]